MTPWSVVPWFHKFTQFTQSHCQPSMFFVFSGMAPFPFPSLWRGFRRLLICRKSHPFWKLRLTKPQMQILQMQDIHSLDMFGHLWRLWILVGCKIIHLLLKATGLICQCLWRKSDWLNHKRVPACASCHVVVCKKSSMSMIPLTTRSQNIKVGFNTNVTLSPKERAFREFCAENNLRSLSASMLLAAGLLAVCRANFLVMYSIAKQKTYE